MAELTVTLSGDVISLDIEAERANLTREQAIQAMAAISAALTAQSLAQPGNQRIHSIGVRGAEVAIVTPGPRVQIRLQLEDNGILGFDLSPELTAELHDFLGKALRALPNLPGTQAQH